MTNPIPEARFQQAYTYDGYRTLMTDLLAQGKTTGPDGERPDMVEYTRVNAQRMHRLETTIALNPELVEALKASKPLRWTVIGECWCGDVAQNLPTIAQMADASEGKIELRIILRDENLDIMDQFLTNGGRSIPVLIAQDPATGAVVGRWGPRPATVQQMVQEYKKNPTKTYKEYAVEVHAWYAQDKTQSLQAEFLALVGQWQQSSVPA